MITPRYHSQFNTSTFVIIIFTIHMDTMKSLCSLEFAPFFAHRFTGIYPLGKF